uniref:Uncharacterized protein n=1 Tax=Arundo donax TaxID=35708 RepID=A0A0A9G7X8_ARUDO
MSNSTNSQQVSESELIRQRTSKSVYSLFYMANKYLNRNLYNGTKDLPLWLPISTARTASRCSLPGSCRHTQSTEGSCPWRSASSPSSLLPAPQVV